jgi:NDP-sugar pyrophosphorylase family protein
MNQPLAYIHPNARIAEDVKIEAFAWIGEDVEIGSGTWIGIIDEATVLTLFALEVIDNKMLTTAKRAVSEFL